MKKNVITMFQNQWSWNGSSKNKKSSLSLFDDKRCYLNETEINLGFKHICYLMNHCKTQRKVWKN